MKAVAKMGKQLSFEERNLFSVAYKNVVGARRSSWRVMESKKEQFKSGYHIKIEKEIQDICNEVVVSIFTLQLRVC